MCDLVSHVYRECRRQATAGGAGYKGTPIHEMYVDEVQDFHESEILLMALVSDANRLFLTGDDAQTIARGLSFRFCDIRTIFHDLHERDSQIGIPAMKLLENNYRTHSGILNLANTVIEIIGFFFPGRVEDIDHDRGLFDGPKPW